MKKILILDPASNPFNDVRLNVGDEIIFMHISEIIRSTFPDHEIIRTPLHTGITIETKELAKKAEYIFVGGSNPLTCNIQNEIRLRPDNKLEYLFPKVRNLILLGTGFHGDTEFPSRLTKFYYRRLFNTGKYLSVRDKVSKATLNKMGIANVLFTGCPTLWNLQKKNHHLSFDKARKSILFTLTNYSKSIEQDSELIKIILEQSKGDLVFFPQNLDDTDYLHSLEIYKVNKSRFKFIEPKLSEYINILRNSNEFNYIGTRLHGGIQALHYNVPSLIISVDNRARSMKESLSLPVIERNEILKVRSWVNGELILPSIQLPVEDIEKWKNQFEKS